MSLEEIKTMEIKSSTATGTTSANGIIKPNIPVASKAILSAYCTSITGIVVTSGETGGNWFFRLTDGTGGAYASQSVTVKYWYIDL